MPETNERGNAIYRDFEADRKLGIHRGEDRYYYDFEALKGWRQFDTSQDAWYFGVWVNICERMTFTYAEGDRTLVICPTLESFKAELANAAEFYGPPPAAVRAIGQDGSVTEYIDSRPTGDPDQDFGDSAIRRALA
jgi:hypothetical protein